VDPSTANRNANGQSNGTHNNNSNVNANGSNGRSSSRPTSTPPARRNNNSNNNYNNNYGMENRTSNGTGGSSSFMSEPRTPQSSSEFPGNANQQNSSGVRRIANSNPPAFMVTVPEGISTGEQFPVTIRGQQLMVTCPPDARPGMSVRIVPPPLPPEQQQSQSNEQPRLRQRSSIERRTSAAGWCLI